MKKLFAGLGAALALWFIWSLGPSADAQVACPPNGTIINCMNLAHTPLAGSERMFAEQNGSVSIGVLDILNAIGVVPTTQSFSANQILGTTNGANGPLSVRALVLNDLPVVDIAHGGTGASTAAGARTDLGLGSAAVLNASGGGATVPTLQANGASTGQCAVFSDNVGTLTSTTCSAGGGGSGTVGAGTASQFPFYATNGTVLTSETSTSITNGDLTLGQNGSIRGSLSLFGGASGKIVIQPQSAAGAYNFNLPTGAGTSGQPLLSGGGGTTAQSYGTLGVAAGGTGATNASSALANLTAGGTTLSNTWSGINTFSNVLILGAAAQDKVRIVTGAGAVTASATTDHLICINKTVGQATTVNLPATPTTGQEFVIKDCKGDANVNNITITPAAGTIEGAATLILSIARQSVVVTAANEVSGANDTWIAH